MIFVISRGRVIDPESKLDAVRDVAVQGGKIVAVSEAPLDGRHMVDARGLVVTAGYIDVHQHGQTPENYAFKARDGVTTALEMEVGVSPVEAWYREREGSRSSISAQTYTESQDPKRVCDGLTLRQHYAGPSFSDEDWRRITGNAVKENGYFFMVYCQEKGGYTIDAGPSRVEVDGTRRFCTDETGTVGCGITWNRSRYACVPCTRYFR